MKQRMNPYTAYDPNAYQVKFPEFEDDALWAKLNPWLQAQRDNERFLQAKAMARQELTRQNLEEFERMMHCSEESDGEEMPVGGEEFCRHIRRHSI